MSNIFTRWQKGAGNTGRGLSHNLWSPSDLEYVRSGALDRGYGFIDDFVSEADYAGNYELDTATAGQIVPLDAKGGVIQVDTNSTTADQGPNLQRLDDTGYENFVATAASDIYFETRLNLADVGANDTASGGANAFIGLSIRDTTIMAAGVNSSTNHVGFETLASADDGFFLSFVTEKAGTRTTHGSTFAFVDGTYIKLGFRIKGVSKIIPYVDGLKKTALTTNIPIVEMAPSIAITGEGSTAPTDPLINLDWIACYQFEHLSH